MTEWNRTVVARLRKLEKRCGWRWLSDLRATGVKQVLDDLVTQEQLSVRTRTHYFQTAIMFGDWLVATHRIPSNPFRARDATGKLILRGRTPRMSDRRRVRRYLRAEEVRRLVAAAEAGPVVQRIPGPDRAMAIRLAVTTGLRRRELGSVTLNSFNFHKQPPTLFIAPGETKNGEGAELPLRSDVVQKFQSWLLAKGEVADDKLLFPIANKRTAEMLRVDLERADIPYRDQHGRVVDWHALRATFASLLILAGEPLVTVQKLMRHSTPTLTANLYATLGLTDFGTAVESLPEVG